MRRAVVHLDLDPSGALAPGRLTRAVAVLRGAGLEIVGHDPGRLRELELVRDGDDAAELRRWAEDVAADALGAGAAPRALAVSFMSSGTVEDALGIVNAFGFAAGAGDLELVGEDVAVLTVAAEVLGDPACGKLLTALEAALNRDVRLVARPR